MPRSIWKGYLKIDEVTCSVALYAAASSADRIAFHQLNRKTGNRVQRQFVDSGSGKAVAQDDQVKGFEVGPDDFIILEPEEIAATVPSSDKTLTIQSFVGCTDVDAVYFDRPYFIGPDQAHDTEAYALIRDGMKSTKVAALAQTVLFRRLRTMLIRPHGTGLIGTTLNFDYEVRDSEEVFADLPEVRINDEMLDLARHIIATKSGDFDPRSFDDRYDAALKELVQAKLEGRAVPRQKPAKVVVSDDLMTALRKSAGKDAPAPASKRKKTPAKPKAATPRRKAG